MVALRKRSTMTVAEFLEWEERQEGRYEFIDGVIYPKDEDVVDATGMVGGTLDHNQIAANVDRALARLLRGTPCRVFRESVKVPVASKIFYPDVFVTCQRLSGRDQMVSEPVVVFEVLSPSTERQDLTTKNRAYRSVPSVKHYFVIAQDELTIECFSRTGEGWMNSTAQGADGVLPIPALGLELPLSDIYEDTDVLAETRAADA
jgi:Uma2 family endonuclease